MNNKILTKENTFALIILFISTIILICMMFSVLDLLNHLLLGVFGASIYIILSLTIIACLAKILGYKNKFSASFSVSLSLIAFSIMFIIHLALTYKSFDLGFSNCMEHTFQTITPAGALFSLILYPLMALLPFEAVISLFVILITICVCICLDKQFRNAHRKVPVFKSSTKTEKVKVNKTSKGQTMKVPNATMEKNKSMPTFISMPLTLNAKIEKDKKNNDNDLLTPKVEYPINIKKMQKDKEFSKIDPSVYKGVIDTNYYDKDKNLTLQDAYDIKDDSYDDVSPLQPQKFVFNDDDDNNFISTPKTILQEKMPNDIDFDNLIDISHDVDKLSNNSEKENKGASEMQSKNTNDFDDIIVKDNANTKFLQKGIKNNVFDKPKKKPSKYIFPPMELLTTQSSVPNISEESYEEKAKIIEEKFEEFKISVKCVGVTRGPAITRYEFEMPQGITVNKVLQYSNDISMVLKSRRAIRMEAPIPGKNAFGIEVPNDKVDIIGLQDFIRSREFKESNSALTFALGKDIANKIVLSDAGKLVHTLIAGSTGSGKSVCLNSILISLLYKSSPKDVRLILIDPKMVEFAIYEKMPHLLFPKIISQTTHAINALSWACEEMERRNRLFGQYYVRSIDEYNDMDEVKNGELEKMYKIVIMVDEFADLMQSSKKEIEERILRLSQKARSSGIHLILAMQRPSVDVITGTIKANLPSRITFSLPNFNDSKTIIDQAGAEKLLGRGDMLYCPRGEEPTRLLGPFISQKEVASVLKFIKEHNTCDYDPEIENAIFVDRSCEPSFVETTDASKDEYFALALRNAIETQNCSISSVQRRFSIGYNRSARIVEEFENRGYISKADGSKARQIYITMEEFLELYGD